MCVHQLCCEYAHKHPFLFTHVPVSVSLMEPLWRDGIVAGGGYVGVDLVRSAGRERMSGKNMSGHWEDCDAA